MSFNILHLSDLHFGLQGKVKMEDVLASFEMKMKEVSVSQPEWKPDFIIISGDISNEAEPIQFEKASSFLNSLQKIFFNKEVGRILCVSGNHDKKRHPDLLKVETIELLERLEGNCLGKFKAKDFKPNIDAFKKELFDKVSIKNDEKEKYSAELKAVFASAQSINVFCNNYFKSYCKFVKPYHSKVVDWIPIKIDNIIAAKYLVGVAHFKSEGVIFVLVNTAWLCENSQRDKGNLTLGDKTILELDNILEKINLDSKNVVITVMHHCPSSFQWGDIHDKKMEVNNFSLISKFSNIILSGHEHGAQVDKPDLIDNEVQLINTGTFYSSESNFSCSLYRIDPSRKTISIKSLIFNKNKYNPKGIWNENNDIKENFWLPGSEKLINELISLEGEKNVLINEKKKLSWLLSKTEN